MANAAAQGARRILFLFNRNNSWTFRLFRRMLPVIASGAKQPWRRALSREFTTAGLRRSARNDGVITQAEFVKNAFPSFSGLNPLISLIPPKEIPNKSLENIWT
jgi:hypothetical protein